MRLAATLKMGGVPPAISEDVARSATKPANRLVAWSPIIPSIVLGSWRGRGTIRDARLEWSGYWSRWDGSCQSLQLDGCILNYPTRAEISNFTEFSQKSEWRTDALQRKADFQVGG